MSVDFTGLDEILNRIADEAEELIINFKDAEKSRKIKVTNDLGRYVFRRGYRLRCGENLSLDEIEKIIQEEMKTEIEKAKRSLE